MASIFDINIVEGDLLADGQTVDFKGLNTTNHTLTLAIKTVIYSMTCPEGLTSMAGDR